MHKDIINTNSVSKERLNSLLGKILVSNQFEEPILLDMIKILVEQGATLPKDVSFVRATAKNGFFDVVKYLIDNGAEMYPELIILALERLNIDFANYLIDKNKELVVKDSWAIYTALRKGVFGINIVKKILDLGINVDIEDGILLITAISYDNEKAVDLLIEYGADVKIRNNIPIEIAVSDSTPYIVRKLIEHRAGDITQNEELLNKAIYRDNSEIVDILLDSFHFSLEACSNALVLACSSRQPNRNIIASLLKEPHDKLSVKKSIKLIKNNIKSTSFGVMNMACILALLKEDKKTIHMRY